MATAYADTGAQEVQSDFKPPKTLSEYRKFLDDYRSNTEDNRTQALIDIDYYDGKQLTPEEKNTLNDRGQPDIIINRTRVAINGILGVTARARSEPRCWPRTPKDEGSSDVATDTLRYVSEANSFKKLKVEAFKDMLVPGTAAFLTRVNADMEIKIDPIRWEEFFIDPRSRRVDGKDARYMGIAKWMFAQDVLPFAKTAAERSEIVDCSNNGIVGMIDESFEDRPIDMGWTDRRSKRLMVVEVYHREGGEWYRCVYYAGGILDVGLSPYLDDKGKPSNPIECVSAYVDRKNQRYGVVRDMRPLQDEINKRRSKLLHLLNSSQIQANDPSAIEVDPDVARKEAARPDGVLPYGWGKVSTTDMSQGQMILLTEAKNEMERFGPNPAVLGRQGADSSGRALLARQQAGLVELALMFDQLEDLELRVYKQCWARAKQFWKEPQFLRVTDDQDDPKFVGINQPKGEPIIDPNTGQPAVNPQTGEPLEGEPQIDPLTGQSIFGYKNAIAEMDVDIIVDTAPETATIMQEALKDLMELVGSNPNWSQQVPFEVVLEMAPIPRKRQIIQKIKEFRAQGAEEQQKQQQMQIEMAVKAAMADMQETLSKVDLNKAKAEQALAEAGLAEAQTHETAIRAIDGSIAEDKAESEPTGA